MSQLHATPLPTTSEVVIIGRSIVGAASAFWPSKAGFKPVIIEQSMRLESETTAASAANSVSRKTWHR